MGGLSVLTSVPGGPPMVCLLCASKGLHEVGPLPSFTAPQVWFLGPSPQGHVPWPSGLTLCLSFRLPTPAGVLPSLL